MKSTADYKPTISSSKMDTMDASIDMTPEMFEMLSSKVYSDKTLAVIREVICNARDANVENNSDKLLDIHTPNRLEPYFSVRDYGKGLGHEELMALYLTYGRSTKTKSNEMIGGFGIGSKSPFAYTSSFTVESVHDGVKRVYSVYKDQGFPKISLLNVSDTDNDSGLLVKVPVKVEHHNEFLDKATKFLQYFDQDVQMNGKTFDRGLPDPFMKTEEVTVYDDFGWGSRIFVRMGGVMYKCPTDNPFASALQDSAYKALRSNNKRYVIDLEIGSLPVAASRESLTEGKETTVLLKVIAVKFINDYLTNLQKKVDSLDSELEVYTFLSNNGFLGYTDTSISYRRALSGLTCTYRGEDLQQIVEDLSTVIPSFQGGSQLVHNILEEIGETVDKVLLFNRDVKRLHMKLYNYLHDDLNIQSYEVDEDQQKIFKKYTDVKIHNTSEVIEKYKDNWKTKAVVRSGLYDVYQRQVKDLDLSEEGYYIIREKSVPQTPLKADPRSVRREIKTLLDKAGIDAEKVYFVNKSALSTIKKSALVHLDETLFKKLLTPKLTKEQEKGILVMASKLPSGGTYRLRSCLGNKTLSKALTDYLAVVAPNLLESVSDTAPNKKPLTILLNDENIKEFYPKLASKIQAKRDKLVLEFKEVEEAIDLILESTLIHSHCAASDSVLDYLKFLTEGEK